MRLEKLVVHGFKSFSDEAVFDFTKNFTAIVGPNGSGKSNISDAIRWVLGEQSLKTLRGRVAHDVIFGGSEKLARLGMANVSLYLDNHDRRLPLDYQQVVITRKVFRNGESEYRINKALVRLQDLLLLLAQGKFGQKSFAVIGQGMITHFLNASPQERKVFFDEATGVKEFQIKRDQAINRLIRTEEHLQKADMLLAEISPRLQSLSRQVKRFEKREKIMEELREVQRHYYGGLWQQLANDMNGKRREQEQKTKHIATLTKKYDDAQKEAEQLAQGSSRTERYEKLQRDHNAVLEEKGHLLKEQAVLKGKLELEHEKRGELRLVWLQRTDDELAREEERLGSELRLLQEETRRWKRDCDAKEKERDCAQEELQKQEEAVLKLRTHVDENMQSRSLAHVRREFVKLFDEQEQFLRRLLATKSLEEFKDVQAYAKQFTKHFADVLDALQHDDEKKLLHEQAAEMKMLEKQMELLSVEREKLQRDVQELSVHLERAKAKSGIFVHALQRMANERAAIAKEQKLLTTGSKNTEYDERIATAQALEEYERKIVTCDRRLQEIRVSLDDFHNAEEEKKMQLVQLQKTLRHLQQECSSAQQEANAVEVQLARIETRQEDLTAEIYHAVVADMVESIFSYCDADAISDDHEDLRRRCDTLQRQLDVIGTIDAETRNEYEETKTRHDFLAEQTRDMTRSLESLEKIIDELDTTIRLQFQKNFKKINEGFEKYFRSLFGGGHARLTMMTEEEREEEAQVVVADANEMVEGDTPQEAERQFIGKRKKKQKIVAGIDIMASPPGKKVMNVTALSGGEKSLAALALLCAIIAHNPSPFMVLDEVEAALDEENSEKVAEILRQLSRKTQIVIITHNRATMRAADILYGVTMGADGKSHILSVALKEAEEIVAQEV